jgi:hypothetical protein
MRGDSVASNLLLKRVDVYFLSINQMQQTPGNLTSDWFDKQVAIYDKSMSELLAVASLKPCVS